MPQLMRPVDFVHNKPFVALLALATHYILNNGEWDNYFHYVLGIWTFAFGGIAVAEYMYDARAKTIGAALHITTTAALFYFGILTASILLRRGFFHRLHKFPGPFLARFSKFYGILAGVFPNFQYYAWSEKVYQEYKSDVIRIGPREVSVHCIDAIPLIHGPMSKCTKGPFYSSQSNVGSSSTQTTRDKDDHKRRRKAWDLALNAKALREYEPRLNRHALALMEQLKEQANQPFVRITDWVNYYSFDVMGDVGFNRSFGMVQRGQEADVIKLLHESMGVLSIFGHIPWAMDLATRTPAGAKPVLEHIKWTGNVLRERQKSIPKENDIFSWLMDPDDREVNPKLNAESRLLVVAGSDTTSATLSWIAYELCKNQKTQDKLRKIINAIEPKKSHLDVEDVANCPFLDGVINEALRLHPPVPSGLVRETPPEGLTLPNGTYIPGNVFVSMPSYSIQRDSRYFHKPLEFLPERWTDEQPDAIMDKRAYMPFSAGLYNCAGQKLATIELRTVTANLVRLFEISFADGEDGSTIEKKTQDCFVTVTGKLDVKLTLLRT